MDEDYRRASVQNKVHQQSNPVPPSIDDHARNEGQQKGNTATQGQIARLEDRVRNAEKWMIWLTGAIAFFGLCGVIVGILQWSAISGQLIEMQRQRLLSQLQFASTERPWIVVKSVSALFFKWQPYMGSLGFNLQPKIEYTNIGNYPADRIRVSQKLFFADQTPGHDFLADVTLRQKEFCESESKNTDSRSVERVYPGRDGVYSPGLGTNPPTRDQVRVSDRIIEPVLIGCIFYHYLSSPTVHYTGFIYVIERKRKPKEGPGQASYALTYGGEVAPGDVVFADGYNGDATYN